MYIHYGTIVPIKFKDYLGMTIAPKLCSKFNLLTLK
jgi:hypothetical protein